MARQRGGYRGIIGGVVSLIVIAAIVIGVLFATGVLGKKPSAQPSSQSPSGQNTNIANPGTVTISNLETIKGECIPPSPCRGPTGVQYTVGSTCSNYTGCSVVVNFTTIYNDNTQDKTSQTHPGVGGTYALLFNSMIPEIIGSTRIPTEVKVSGYSVNNGVKGQESSPVSIYLYN